MATSSIRSEEEGVGEKEVVYSTTSCWYFLQQLIKAILRRLGFTSKTTADGDSDRSTPYLSNDQPQDQSTQSKEEDEMATTFVVTSRSVATTAYRKPGRGPVTSGKGPKTNAYAA